MNYYKNTIENNPLLKHEEFLKLINTYQDKNNSLMDRKKAQEKIILANIKLVKKIAWNLNYSNIDYEELINEWLLWIIRAIDKFEPQKWFKFSTYANYWIFQSIKKYIDNNTSVIRIPVNKRKDMNRLNTNYSKRFSELWRNPSIKELTESTWLTEKKILELQKLIYDQNFISIDNDNSDSDMIRPFLDLRSKTPWIEFQLIQTELFENINEILDKKIPKRSNDIYKKYYLDDWNTLNSIWKEYSLTRERVRQILENINNEIIYFLKLKWMYIDDLSKKF